MKAHARVKTVTKSAKPRWKQRRVKPLAAIREAIRLTRADHAEVIAAMPRKATTAGQRALQKKHGTPKAFAIAAVNTIGEISVLEANAAIRKYLHEWEAA